MKKEREGKDEYCAKRTLSFILLLFCLLINLTVLSGLVQAQQSEQEAVECIEENTLTALTYGGFTTACEIDVITDVDRFNFDGVVGENIRIKVIELDDNTMQLRLEVRDPNGDTILDTWEYDIIERDLELTTSGEYLIAVSDVSSDQVGNYMVSIDRFPPTFGPLQLISDNSLDDEIDPITDIDFFTFEGFEGDDIRIKVIELDDNTMQLRLEVREPNGDIILDTWEYDIIERDLELTTSGEYLITVSDVSSDQVGNYQIAYQCLFGDCLESTSSCPYYISPTSESFGSSGGTGSVSVTDTNDCGWEAVSNDTDWITIDSGNSGTGQATVSYTVAKYTGTTSRTGTMTIAGKTFTVTQYPFNVIDGLVAYYPFNGNADDESGNGNDGTVNGATLTEDMSGNADSAYSFDGIDDYVSIGTNVKPDLPITVSAWINLNDINTGTFGEATIIRNDNWNHTSKYYGLHIGNVNGYLMCRIGNGGIAAGSSRAGRKTEEPVFSEGNWYHIVVVVLAYNDMSFFVNGSEYESVNEGGTATSMVYSSSSGIIGYSVDTQFEGKIDDIQVYDRVLSESEIQELYQGNTSCASISPTSGSFYTSGVTGSVSVTAESDCDWTAISNDPDWITIQSGSSGSGDGTVTYFVAENPYTSLRTGTMTIAGTIFTVSQDGTGSTDEDAPSVTILSPVDGVTQSLIYIITGSSTDPPPSSGIDRVEIQVYDGTQYLGQDGKWYDSEEQTIKAEGAESWYHDTSNVTWVDGVTYTITAKVYDIEGYQGTTSIEVTFSSDSGGQAYSTLSLELSSQTILQNETIDASGKLTRLPDNGTDLSGETVNLTITPPVGDSTTYTTETYDSYGHYRLEDLSGLTQKGTYIVQASFEETNTLAESSSDALTVLVGSSAGYAIIIEGKVSSEEGLDSHNKTANRIYDTLLARGFVDENIYYFNYDTSQAGVDASPDKADIQYSINTWPMDKMNGSPAPLYIVLYDHGNTDTFYVYNDDDDDTNDTITPSELDSWLETLESGLNSNALQEKRIIIYGACYSGSFISALSKAPTDTDGGRVIVTSAAEDEESYKGTMEPDGIRSGSYFLEEFFNELERGYSIKESFETATEKTEAYTREGGDCANTNNAYFDCSMQHPLLDDDGDGVGSNVLSDGTGDGQIAKDLYLGTGVTYDTNSATNPAEIIYVTDTVHLGPFASKNEYLMWATANDNNEVSSVWMEVRPPSQTLSGTGESNSNQLSTDYTKELMSLNESTENWEEQIDTFTESGMYEIFYFARDTTTLEISPMKRSVVYKDKIGNNPPSIFSLISPEYGSEERTILAFEWEASSDPDGDYITYNLLIATDEDFNDIVYKKEEITTTAAIVDSDAGLSDLTNYYWKVQAVDAYGLTTDSKQTWPFYTNNTNYGFGYITGIVYDARSFAPIVGATVKTDFGDEDATKTEGYYIMSANEGTYTVICSFNGYSDTSFSGISVSDGKTTELNIPMTSSVTSTDPTTDIKANGSEGPVTISQGDLLTVEVSLDPESHGGENADWWVYATSPFGTYWYTLDPGWVPSNTPIRVYGGPLFSLPPYTVMDLSTLPVGSYTFIFEVDNNMDNVKDGTYTDSVEVNIQ